MNSLKYRYPESPKNVNPFLLEPSPEFRKEAWAVVRAIVVFILTYFILVLSAVGLAFACAYAGYWIIVNVHHFWAIAFGIGIAGLGIMVVIFLFKFIFKSSVADRSRMTEITAREQPLLFDFIERIAKETHTRVPKRVYISPDVNASVFYDSSFWSMFLPVRKQLNIGLGLVNTVNVSELKAVIAHEFGHFSQRSMALGSYTYYVNHIIHDMLYDNDDYEKTLETWGNTIHIFAFFATLTGVAVDVIKEILQKLYKGINERYLALSRQMEFHADAISASVSGSASLVTGLYRLNVSNDCYQSVLNYYDRWVSQNKKGENLYEHHGLLMQEFAGARGLVVENNIIQIDAKAYQQLRRSRIQIRDQWASHPDTVDRAENLLALKLDADIVSDSAWTLFTDAEKLQRQVTEIIYADARFQQAPELIDGNTFKSLLKNDSDKFSLNKVYKGFYDDRDISVFDPVALSLEGSVRGDRLSDVLTESVLALPAFIETLKYDIEVLERLQDKSSTVATFDFEGIKHDRKDARELVKRLQGELAQATADLENADRDVFLLYSKRCANGDACKLYRDLFADQEKRSEELKLAMSMIREASQLFDRSDLTREMWVAISNNMHRDAFRIKQSMVAFLAIENVSECCSNEQKNVLQAFVDDKRKYFFNVGCDSEAINLHVQAVHIYSALVAAKSFQMKKRVLDAQAEVLLFSIPA